MTSKQHHPTILTLMAILFAMVSACGGGSGPPIPSDTTICLNTIHDSLLSDGIATRINSKDHGSPVYHFMPAVRKTIDGDDVSIDYMLHPSVGLPKALLVLFAGGQLDAGIEGVDGLDVTSAGGNFLVRSAHLFAEQGYRVVTIDRPADFTSDIDGSDSGHAYDTYRTSVRHAVDISSIIATENSIDNLHVLFAGTSRGAISIVAQHKLASAISLSSPATSGSGFPLSNDSPLPLVRPVNVSVPAHVMWHVADTCNVTAPTDAEKLVYAFTKEAARNPVRGGFDDPAKLNDCRSNTVHGFFGIESCAAGLSTDWLDSLELPATRPTALAVNTTAVWTVIDLAAYTSSAVPGAELSYHLPFTQSSLGGTVSLSGSIVTYTPPAGVSKTMDSFVYLVKEEDGGTSHNVIRQTLP